MLAFGVPIIFDLDKTYFPNFVSCHLFQRIHKIYLNNLPFYNKICIFCNKFLCELLFKDLLTML